MTLCQYKSAESEYAVSVKEHLVWLHCYRIRALSLIILSQYKGNQSDYTVSE